MKIYKLILGLCGFCILHITPALAAPPVVKLIFDDRIVTINFQSHPYLLQEVPEHYVKVGTQKIPVDFEDNLPLMSDFLSLDTEFKTVVSIEKLQEYFATTSLLGQKSDKPIELSMTDKGWVKISGRPRVGSFEVDFDQLVDLLNEAIASEQKYIRVPSHKVYNPVLADEALQARGIKEIVAIGRSNFSGSSRARIQNIMAGARKFDGMIVGKGKNFSFNHTLESVEEKDGFVKELVIKGNKTEKELGGGVCQVSTTVYRAAFEAGLPILDRRSHSYAVPYYKPHGFDATIYLGGQDFRFKNDTPGDLLVQSFVQGNDLFFVFYGTPDNRKVAFEGPFISGYKKAPSPEIFETTELPVGEVVEASPAHDGFRAEWIRRVSKGGEVEEETFISNYRPWAAKMLKGVESDALANSPEAIPMPLDEAEPIAISKDL